MQQHIMEPDSPIARILAAVDILGDRATWQAIAQRVAARDLAIARVRRIIDNLTISGALVRDGKIYRRTQP